LAKGNNKTSRLTASREWISLDGAGIIPAPFFVGADEQTAGEYLAVSRLVAEAGG
jgi:hypothetical protein